MNNAPNIPTERFTAMTRLDHNRAIAQLAQKTGTTVPDITKMTIWGNHGKRRTVAFHRETMAELEYYLKLRDAEIMRSEGRGTIPDSLLIYFGQGRELHTYKRTAVDVRLARVAKRTGLKFTNHTLRRTYGRTLWLAGVPLETISSLMGHEDTKTTTQYLGLNMDDKESAMRKLAEFESAVKCGKNLSSSQISGQSGTTARPNVWIAPKLP
jgi:integrase